MEIIIGTYEEFLVGYQLKKQHESKSINNDNDDNSCKYSLEQSFTNHCHNGYIKCMAISSKYLASGSLDEKINLINIRYRRETGTLLSHTGTITSLKFLPNSSSYLFSASEDGTIGIWCSKRSWNLEKLLRGHKDSVIDISVHTSGKLLLSISKDLTLRTWNLVKGRCAYIVNLKQVGNQIQWSPSCSYFAIVFNDHIDIYDISNGSIVHSVPQKTVGGKRLNRLQFITDNIIAIISDSTDLIIYDLKSEKIINKIENAHENRIKDIQILEWNSLELNDELSALIDENDRKSNRLWLFTCSSDGFIKIWSFNRENLAEKPLLLAKVDSTCRPTCMTVWNSSMKSVKNNRNDFIVPELAISKEELELCRAKSMKKSRAIDQVSLGKIGEDNDDKDDADEDEEEEDDALAISEMKRRISRKKKIMKHKNSKKKLMTFKMKKQLIRQKQNQFKTTLIK